MSSNDAALHNGVFMLRAGLVRPLSLYLLLRWWHRPVFLWGRTCKILMESVVRMWWTSHMMVDEGLWKVKGLKTKEERWWYELICWMKLLNE